MPRPLLEVIRAAACELASSGSVTVLATDTYLTPAEAAEALGLSRRFLVALLDAGEIESERLPGSRHRRVRLAHVLVFAARREERRVGRRQIGEALADAGAPY